MSILVWVPGAAKTKGSVDVQRGRRVTQSVRGSEDWAALVTKAIWTQHGIERPPTAPWAFPAGPVAVSLRFWLPVTQAWTTGSGDSDKLARNVLDAVTKSRAYADDVQVTHLQVEKYPARPHPGPGLLLKVWQLAPLPLDEIGWAELQRHFATSASWPWRSEIRD